MRKLLNTLYITRETAFLSLDGENIVIKEDSEEIARFPLHMLEGIVSFSYLGASPALMGKCAEMGIGLSFCSPYGKFLARSEGKSRGNVLLRREQYRIADDPKWSAEIARMMLTGKVYNTRWVVERTKRDHALRVDESRLESTVNELKKSLTAIQTAEDLDSLRGIEGSAASAYFGVFDQLILRDKETFCFKERNRRPPKDPCNALLSFVYMLLTSMCVNAAESVGLDSYVGFLHCDRPGRTSLALDLMEELRPCMADRFVLTLINNKVIQPADFTKSENGAVSITDSGRKRILQAWQERKQDVITHPYLSEKLPWGLVPFIQAQLLSRFIRGDLDAYPPFLWK
ncbi:MAG: type I-C CRISPR-associated endonuclease Cas1 [Lachnospiraceae bacterium]|nr:type I-C CRISPR-associated endonuclease Cas1 [Lachnospiraceae bacterium]